MRSERWLNPQTMARRRDVLSIERRLVRRPLVVYPLVTKATTT